MLLTLILVSQLYILSLNGFLAPKLENTLVNSPLATYVLKNYPTYYNPTPEIFVDRTNHTDLGYLQTAAFRRDGATGPCTKAFVLLTDKDLLESYCGDTPAEYLAKFGNPFKRKATYARTAKVLEATFWPDPASCGKDYVPSEKSPFVCMKTIEQAARGFGVDSSRLTKLKDYDYPGIWKVKLGGPVKVTVPAGYTMDAVLLDGFYVNYK